MIVRIGRKKQESMNRRRAICWSRADQLARFAVRMLKKSGENRRAREKERLCRKQRKKRRHNNREVNRVQATN